MLELLSLMARKMMAQLQSCRNLKPEVSKYMGDAMMEARRGRGKERVARARLIKPDLFEADQSCYHTALDQWLADEERQ